MSHRHIIFPLRGSQKVTHASSVTSRPPHIQKNTVNAYFIGMRVWLVSHVRFRAVSCVCLAEALEHYLSEHGDVWYLGLICSV